jgi:uncharacterized protein YjeT (DUF2065 family)
MAYFLCVLGMVFIVEGLPYFAFPETIRRYLLTLAKLPDSKLRLIGGGAIGIGLTLLYFGRS